MVGTNRQVYVDPVGASNVFVSLGGQTTADPALTPANPPLTPISAEALAVFCRGTDGAGYYSWYTRDSVSPWRSMGGKLTTGVSAATATVSGQITTYTAGLGTSNGEYADVGTWPSGTPAFSGWKG